jgi:hypothetical protein
MPSDLDGYDSWEIAEVSAFLRLEKSLTRNSQSTEQFAAMAAQRKADEDAGQSGPPVLGKKKSK